MTSTYYLLTTMIEYGDSVSDYHSLYLRQETAINMFAIEVEQCAENFAGKKGDFIIDLPSCKEWRNEDGYGYTVTVEEVKPL